MKRICAILVGLLAVGGVANAVIVQTIKLKDGTELSGYIKQQNLNGTMTISADKAIVCIDNSHNKVSISAGTNYDEASLSEAWIEWAEQNDEFEGLKGNRKLQLNDVSMAGGGSANKVKILERGAVVKYLRLDKGVEYKVKWADVVTIKGERRPKNALSGIDRIFQLKNGTTVEGQYAEETDSTISLYLNNGEVQTFKTLNVVKYTYKPINPNQNIFEQSPLIDVVTCKNGATVTGIITEQNYLSNSDEKNYIIVRQDGDVISSIKISDIKTVRKEDNSSRYKPKYDILLSEGDVVVNRGEVVFVGVKESDSGIVLDSISNKVTIPFGQGKETEISVEYRNSNYVNVEMFQLVRVRTTENKKKVKTYSFTYKDLASDAVYKATSIETSKNKTTKAVYKVDSKGLYALYDSKSKKAIPVIVE